MQKGKIIFLLLFLIVFFVGITIRIARFPDIPPGLNQDEANSATETYSLLETGKDKNQRKTVVFSNEEWEVGWIE